MNGLAKPGAEHGAPGAPPSVLLWVAVWLGLLVVAILGVRQTANLPFQISLAEVLHGIRPVLPITAWAALRVWIFWALGAAVVAGFLLRLDPSIDGVDAVLGGAGGLWALAWFVGNLLGSVGLLREPVVMGLVGLGLFWLWLRPPRIRLAPPTHGQWLALLAWALLALSMLPLQLGSPIPPFMDVLSYPSSVQRILTFGVYLPFNNDPYGVFGSFAQTPALELFYALLALGSRTRLGALAMTAAMVPMSGLLLFATYRLGKTLFNDTAGGIAALLLFFTCLLRREQGMRGTAVALALVALGLAFFADPRRDRTLMGLGAIMLGAAVGSHAIDGGLGLTVAGAAGIFFLASGDISRFVVAVVCLGGAALIAAPELAVGLTHPVPYPALVLAQLLGGILIVVGVKRLPPGQCPPPPRLLNLAAVGLLIALIVVKDVTQPGSILQRLADNAPLLFIFCFAGFIALAGVWWSDPEAMPQGGLAAVALLLVIAAESLASHLVAAAGSPSARMMADDIGWKLLDYWGPYFLLFSAGLLFALLYDGWSKPLTFFALLTILLYPWRRVEHPADFDSWQHSITEHWAFNLHTAAQGYWVGSPDSRWLLGPNERALVDVLEREIKQGRITPATHVLHIAGDTSAWGLVQFPVFTGINDDPITYHYPGNAGWLAGGRGRGINDLRRALMRRPPYILEQVPPPAWMHEPPNGYEEIFHRDNLRLFRRVAVTDSPAEGPR